MPFNYLDNLPVELLQEISGYLAPFEESHRSFRQLSSVTGHAGEIHAYHTCRLKGGSFQQLLQNLNSFRQHGDPILRQSPNDPETSGNKPAAHLKHVRVLRISGDIQSSLDAEEFWQSLFKLFDDLPGLKEFYYDLTYQLPNSLLLKLNANPRVALHLLWFQMEKPAEGLTEHEKQLVACPSLKSIHVSPHDSQANNAEWYYTLETVLEMAAGLSPSLEAVTIEHWQHAPIIPEMSDVIRQIQIRPPSERMPRVFDGSALRALTFNCNFSHPDHQIISWWTSRVNLENLRTLDIDFPDGNGYLPDSWPDPNLRFPALRHLLVRIPDLSDPLQAARQTNNLAVFLKSLVGLLTLIIRIPNTTTDLFEAMVIHMGTVKSLSLDYPYDPFWFDVSGFLLLLLAHAVNLEFLSLRLYDTEEGDNYRTTLSDTLSRMHKLRHVIFTVVGMPNNPEIDPATVQGHHYSFDDQKRRTKSHWRALVEARASLYGHVGWALNSFVCEVQWPKVRYERRRDWFEFRDIEEESEQGFERYVPEERRVPPMTLYMRQKYT